MPPRLDLCRLGENKAARMPGPFNRRSKPDTSSGADGGPWSTVRFILGLALLAWAVRSFLVAPFSIPSGSMLPTLYIGDYQAARTAFDQTFYNLPYANYSAFLDAVSSGEAKLLVEPGPAGQQYYAAVGSVVSAILTDESVDPAAALQEAQANFQSTQLDTIAAS